MTAPLPPELQEKVRNLAGQLLAHRDLPQFKSKEDSFNYVIRDQLDAAHSAVLAILDSSDPHDAAVRALNSLLRVRLDKVGLPPHGGRSNYVRQLNTVVGATAPEAPHAVRAVVVPVHFFQVEPDAPQWRAAICVDGQWYSRHCDGPDAVQDLGPVLQRPEGVRAPYPWSHPWLEEPEFTPDAEGIVKRLPVEFPLLVRRLRTDGSKEFDGLRKWIPAPGGEQVPPSTSHAESAERMTDQEKVRAAAEVATRFGGIEGEHHKTWVIDQMLRILMDDKYGDFIRESGEQGYDWDTGVAP